MSDCPSRPPSTGQTTHPSSGALLNYLSWTPGTATAKSKKRSHNKVTTLVLAPQWWIELPADVADQLPQERDSRLACSVFTRTLHSLPYPPRPSLPNCSHKNTPFTHLLYVCMSWHFMYALIVCCTSWHLKIVLSIM